MRLIVIIFFVLSCQSLSSYAQNDPDVEMEVFKEKLQNYYEKRNKPDDLPMSVIPLDSAKYNMPTADLWSLMIDEETGLAYEFATQRIYDKETMLVYFIEKEKIYDPKTRTYYHYEIRPNQ